MKHLNTLVCKGFLWVSIKTLAYLFQLIPAKQLCLRSKQYCIPIQHQLSQNSLSTGDDYFTAATRQ